MTELKKQREVILVIGTSGSGKTTWSKAYAKSSKTHIHISADDRKKTIDRKHK